MLALNCGAIAVPCASVPTSTAFAPLEAKIPLGPLPGAANVTAIPESCVVSGQPSVFASATWRFVWNGEPSLALCGVPPPSTSSFGALYDGQSAVCEVAPAALPDAAQQTTRTAVSARITNCSRR